MAGFQYDFGLATSLFGEIANLDAVWLDGAATVAVTGRFGVELWQIGSGEPVELASVSIIAAPGASPDTDLNVTAGVAELLISGGFAGGSQSVDVVLSNPTPQSTTLGGPDRHPAALNWEAFGFDTYAYAQSGTNGLTLARVNTDGSLTDETGLDPADTLRVGAVSVLERISLGGREFVVALSASGNRVSVVEVLANGAATVTATLGVSDGLPISAPVSLAIAQAGGSTFVIVGASQTSSLAVLQLESNGSLILTDYVVDTLNTRFEGAPALAALSGATVAHVVAGGSDDGITSMILTGEGRLIHVSTLADTLETTLSGVGALDVFESDTGIGVIAGDQTGGVSFFSYTPLGTDGVLTAAQGGATVIGGAGEELLLGSGEEDELSAGAGDDVLLDGRGADTLTGGAGRDVFVFVDDGAVDRITDFDPSQDRLDFTGYTGATDPGSLAITGTSTQMTVTIDNDTLILTAANGVTLTEAAVRASVALSFDRPVLPTAARVLVGSEGADTLLGAAADDTIDGAGGDDLIVGEAGADSLSGGAGEDTLLGAGVEDDIIDFDEPADFFGYI